MGILAGLMVAGMAVSVYGQITAAEAKQKADEQQAAMQRSQADEMASREAINEDIMQRRGNQEASALGSQQSTSQSEQGIGGQLAAMYNTKQSIANANREAAWKENMLRIGAVQSEQMGSDAMKAGYIGSASTVLGGAGSVYQASQPPGKPTPLPG